MQLETPQPFEVTIELARQKFIGARNMFGTINLSLSPLEMIKNYNATKPPNTAKFQETPKTIGTIEQAQFYLRELNAIKLEPDAEADVIKDKIKTVREEARSFEIADADHDAMVNLTGQISNFRQRAMDVGIQDATKIDKDQLIINVKKDAATFQIDPTLTLNQALESLTAFRNRLTNLGIDTTKEMPSSELVERIKRDAELIGKKDPNLPLDKLLNSLENFRSQLGHIGIRIEIRSTADLLSSLTSDSTLIGAKPGESIQQRIKKIKNYRRQATDYAIPHADSAPIHKVKANLENFFHMVENAGIDKGALSPDQLIDRIQAQARRSGLTDPNTRPVTDILKELADIRDGIDRAGIDTILSNEEIADKLRTDALTAGIPLQEHDHDLSLIDLKNRLIGIRNRSRELNIPGADKDILALTATIRIYGAMSGVQNPDTTHIFDILNKIDTEIKDAQRAGMANPATSPFEEVVRHNKLTRAKAQRTGILNANEIQMTELVMKTRTNAALLGLANSTTDSLENLLSEIEHFRKSVKVSRIENGESEDLAIVIASLITEAQRAQISNINTKKSQQLAQDLEAFRLNAIDANIPNASVATIEELVTKIRNDAESAGLPNAQDKEPILLCNDIDSLRQTGLIQAYIQDARDLPMIDLVERIKDEGIKAGVDPAEQDLYEHIKKIGSVRSQAQKIELEDWNSSTIETIVEKIELFKHRCREIGIQDVDTKTIEEIKVLIDLDITAISSSASDPLETKVNLLLEIRNNLQLIQHPDPLNIGIITAVAQLTDFRHQVDIIGIPNAGTSSFPDLVTVVRSEGAKIGIADVDKPLIEIITAIQEIRRDAPQIGLASDSTLEIIAERLRVYRTSATRIGAINAESLSITDLLTEIERIAAVESIPFTGRPLDQVIDDVLTKQQRIILTAASAKETVPGEFEMTAARIEDWNNTPLEVMMHNLNLVRGGDLDYQGRTISTDGFVTQEINHLNTVRSLQTQIIDVEGHLSRLSQYLQGLNLTPKDRQRSETLHGIETFLNNPTASIEQITSDIKSLGWSAQNRADIQRLFDNEIAANPKYKQYIWAVYGHDDTAGHHPGVNDQNPRRIKLNQDYLKLTGVEFSSEDKAKYDQQRTVITEVLQYLQRFTVNDVNLLYKQIADGSIVNNMDVPQKLRGAFRLILGEIQKTGSRLRLQDLVPQERYLIQIARILTGTEREITIKGRVI